ncbi:MAG: HipA domain-containing protein [Pseudomonadota bacterium]
MSKVATLEVMLHDTLVGYLTHYPDERTTFVVDESYIEYGAGRPILSLSLARPNDEGATRALLLDDRNKSANPKAPPFFSNLLPEGGLRKRIAMGLKVHEDREFMLLSALGEDLPGAVIMRAVDTPAHLFGRRGAKPDAEDSDALRFALAGMQMKFSMLQQGERFTLAGAGQLGNYIVKPPAHDFEALPMVEAAMMETARAVGIDVPEVQLLPPTSIEGLSNMSGYRRDEPFYAVRRFDRTEAGRVHVEDFAQVFNLRVNNKYDKANYEMIAKTLLLYGGGLADLQEMSRRLVLNVLLGNGDAHIKNWSLIYDDPAQPRLAPAYDLVSTVVYTKQDTSLALNMGGVKTFADISINTFKTLFERIGIADRVLEGLLEETSSTGRKILETWEDVYRQKHVPEALIDKVRSHQDGLALTRELRIVQS